MQARTVGGLVDFMKPQSDQQSLCARCRTACLVNRSVIKCTCISMHTELNQTTAVEIRVN